MIFDLKPIGYYLFHSNITIFSCEFIQRTALSLLSKWGFFKIYLCPQEAIEVIEVNIAAN